MNPLNIIRAIINAISRYREHRREISKLSERLVKSLEDLGNPPFKYCVYWCRSNKEFRIEFSLNSQIRIFTLNTNEVKMLCRNLEELHKIRAEQGTDWQDGILALELNICRKAFLVQ